MGKKVKRKKSKLKIIGIIYFVLLGLMIYLSILNGGMDAVKDLLLILLNIVISYIIVVNIHEFGHYVFGKLYGYELISYRVSFFAWTKENGKFKFSFIKNKGYSGLCLMVPPKKELPKYKEILKYAAGNLFNFLFGVIIIIINLTLINNKGFNGLFRVMGMLSLITSLINSLPIMFGNIASDGKVIWSLLLKKPFGNKLTIIKRLLTQQINGIRPSHLDIPNIDMFAIEPLDTYLLLDCYYKALDQEEMGDLVYFANLLEENIDKIPAQLLPVIQSELCFLGCITDDINKAKTYYKQCEKTLIKDNELNGYRKKAYYAFYVMNDRESAIRLCNQGLAVSDEFSIKGQTFMEVELIKSLMELINMNN